MESIEELLKHADECRTMATKSSNDMLRSKFSELARRWIELAEERERFLKAAPRNQKRGEH